MWKNNMANIARVGALTAPQFRNMPTLDLGGAFDNYVNARDKSLEAARRQAYVDELTAAHPEAAAQIAADPTAYMKMLNDKEAAERDQQYKMDQLNAHFENQMKLQNAANALRNQQAKAEQEARIAAIEDAHNSGRMQDAEYYKAIDAAKMGDKLYEIAYGKPAGGTFDSKGVMELRKEHRQNNKDYYIVGDAYSRMRKVAENPSAAGDISMIFSYMKMLDPNSTVREGEYATAQNAAGIPTRVMNLYNQTLQGTRLSDLQRNDFLNQAGNLFAAQKARFDRESDYYRDIAAKSGLNPDDVIYDPYDFGASKQDQYPEGTVIENEKGVRMVLRGGQWQQM